MKHRLLIPLFIIPLLLFSCLVAPSLERTSGQPNYAYPVEFPLPALTESQILDVSNCDIENIVLNRYPESVTEDQLGKQFVPKSGCDWAVLAFAYAKRSRGDSTSPLGLAAFENALRTNYGYALSDPIFYAYFGEVIMVGNPKFADQEIREINISYNWGGLGDFPSDGYSFSIINANTKPIIESKSSIIDTNVILNKDMVQDLRLGLINFLPIKSEISIVPCTDNFPSWLVVIVFMDGTELTLTAHSNFLTSGGPWEMTMDGQTYIQFSSELLEKIVQLMDAIGLPLGVPDGMYCERDTVFEKAFSVPLLPTVTPQPNPTANALGTAAMEAVEAAFTRVALTNQPVRTPTP